MRRLSLQSWITLIIGLMGLAVLLATSSAGSDGTQVLARYSGRYIVIIAAYGILMAVGMLILSLHIPTYPAWVWLVFAIGGLIFATWLPLLDHTWWLNVTLKISAAWLVLGLVWCSKASFSTPRAWYSVLIGGCIFLIVFNILSLIEFPMVQTIDEGWDANLGWTFVHEGVLYTRINQGVFGKPELFAPVGNVLPAYWLTVAGLGFFQARSLVMYGGFIMLALTYATARHIYRDRWVAIICVILLAASYVFFTTSHLFRLDLYVGLAGLGAIYLFLRSTQRPWLAFAAGFVVAAAVELHQNAFLLAVGAGLYLLLWITVRSVRARHLSVLKRDMLFMAGGLAGSSLFLIFHVLPNPSEFVRQFGFSIGMHTAVPPDWITPLGPLAFLVRGILNYSQVSPFEPALVVVLVVLAWGVRMTRPLVLLLLSLVVVYALISPSLAFGYFINFWPLVAIIAGGSLFYEGQRRSVIVIVICIAVALPGLAAISKQYSVLTNRNMMAIARQINESLTPTDRVVALHSYFLLMPHPPEIIAPFMAAYSELNRKTSAGADIWDQMAPDVFIVSSNLDEPVDPVAQIYRSQNGFVQIGSYNQAGCCVVVYRRPPK